jgi:hypothetical protein
MMAWFMVGFITLYQLMARYLNIIIIMLPVSAIRYFGYQNGARSTFLLEVVSNSTNCCLLLLVVAVAV